MPKLNDFQKSTIALLDYLYFHDIVAMETFSDEKLNVYGKLDALLQCLAHNRTNGDLRIEHYKHLLIVGLDFELTFTLDKDIVKGDEYDQMKTNYRTYLVQQIEQLDFNLDEYEEDLEAILARIPINMLSAEVALKIVSQMLYYEYDNITIGVFSKFLEHGFLVSTKYTKKRQMIDEQFLDKLFYRAMLFLEFEVTKNNLINEVCAEPQYIDLNNLQDYKKIIAYIETRGKAQSLKKIEYGGIHTVKTKNDLKKFVTNIEGRLGHNPIFSDGLANWIALIGAWHLMLEKKTNIDRSLFQEHSYKEDSCAKLACQKLEKYGLTVSEKTLFDCYDRVYEIYRLIRITMSVLVNNELYGPREKVLTQDFFYNPNSHPDFKKQLKVAMSKL